MAMQEAVAGEPDAVVPASQTGKATDGPSRSRSMEVHARKPLQLAAKAVLVVVGLRVGIAIAKRARQLLQGDNSSRGSGGSRQQEPGPTDNQPLAAVPPAAHWAPSSQAPPAIPPDCKPLVSVTLPCTVYSFYHHVFSQQSNWLQEQHELIGRQYNYVKRKWYPTPTNVAEYPDADDKSMLQPLGRTVFDMVLGGGGAAGFTRTITFVTPPKPPNSVDASCVQRQQFAVFSGNTLMMATAMNMLNIPFKDCFMVCTVWSATPSPDPNARSCTLTVSAKVHFVKGTMLSGIIRATTARDMNSFYKALAANMATMLAAAPHVPEPAGGRGLARLPSRNLTRSAAPGAAPASAGGSSLAETVPLRRQLRVLLVMLVLIGSLVHQVLLHRELRAITRHLGVKEAH